MVLVFWICPCHGVRSYRVLNFIEGVLLFRTPVKCTLLYPFLTDGRLLYFHFLIPFKSDLDHTP